MKIYLHQSFLQALTVTNRESMAAKTAINASCTMAGARVDTEDLSVQPSPSSNCTGVLTLVDTLVPGAGPGNGFQLITMLIEVSAQCGDIELLSMSAELPGRVSMVSEHEPGDILAPGSVFPIYLRNRTGGSITGSGESVGEITIEYNSVETEGPAKKFKIDQLAELVAA